MPPIKRFDKEDIINISLDIISKDGIDKLNARRIAKELHSSVNPIFNNFKNMDDLKNELYKRIYQLYQEYMQNGKNAKDVISPYKGMGMGYIKFAKDYPEYFKMIFMQKSDLTAENFIMADAEGNDVLSEGQKLTGLSYEEQKKLHIRVWIFTHGIACLVATNTVKLSEQEISELLENTVRQMIIGYLKEKGAK